MKIQNYYINWKTKRDKELAEKIALQDPVIRKENNCKKVSWRDRSGIRESCKMEFGYKGYFEQRIY